MLQDGRIRALTATMGLAMLAQLTACGAGARDTTADTGGPATLLSASTPINAESAQTGPVQIEPADTDRAGTEPVESEVAGADERTNRGAADPWHTTKAAGSFGPTIANAVAAPSQSQMAARKRIPNPMTARYRAFNILYPDTYPSGQDRARAQADETAAVDVSYERFLWRQVQPRRPTATDDGFDWNLLETRIAAAAAQGRRFAFRVMPVSTPDQALPDWLAQDSNATVFHGPTYWAWVPAWDSAGYQAALQYLLNRLAERFDGDDRIAFVDAMGYGDWGEGHVWSLGMREASDETILRIANLNYTAFRKTRVVQFTGHVATLADAAKRPDVGLRVDCLGDGTGGWAFVNMTETPGAAQKWQTAPVITEWCNRSIVDAAGAGYVRVMPQLSFMVPDLYADLYEVASRQVRRWHVSLLSGVMPECGANAGGACLSDSQFATFHRTLDQSGFRYHVRAASAPQWAQSGAAVPVSLEWRNFGVAPTYENWWPRIQLRDAKGNVVLDQAVSVNLKTLHANGSGEGNFEPPVALRTSSEALRLPTELAKGTYTMTVKVARAKPQKSNATRLMPASHYQRAMVLEGEGPRTADNAQVVGTLEIR